MPARRGSWLLRQDLIEFWQLASPYFQRHRKQDTSESMYM